MKQIKLIFLICLTGCLFACNNDHLNVNRVPRAGQQGDNSDAPVTYYRDIQPLFQKMCSTCHGQGSPLGDWQNYEVVLARKDRMIDRVVVKKDMPLGQPMSDAERALVQQWIQLGAPMGKKSGQPTLPTPAEPAPSEPAPAVPAQPLPQELHYAKVKAEVFDKYCVACHNENSAPMMPNWNDYNVVLAKKDRIMQRVFVDKNMPIGDPMPEEAMNLLKQWIEEGAKN